MTAAPGDTVLVSRASGLHGAKGDREETLAERGPAISADGRFVAFQSQARNLHPDAQDPGEVEDPDLGFPPDIFVRDLAQNITILVSRASGANGATGDDWSRNPAISGDGRFVAFQSEATNLDPDKTDRITDIFVRDLEENTTILVSRVSGADGAKAEPSFSGSTNPSISADGRFVAFQSTARNLHPDVERSEEPEDPDKPGVPHIFVRDLVENTTTLVSRASGFDGEVGDGVSTGASISADGRFVAFQSEAKNLHPDADGRFVGIYVRDLQESTTTLVSPPSSPWGSPSISADGRFVAFHSGTSLAEDRSGRVYVRDLEQGTMTLVSRARGANGEVGDDYATHPSISADGRFVAFPSPARNLHPDGDDRFTHIYVRDLRENTTTLVSRASGAGMKGDGFSGSPSISADGRFVVFDSTATNLNPDDNDRIRDVFRRDLSEVDLDRPAKLEVNRARVRNRRLVLRGSLDPTASAGERVAVRYRAAGKRIAERVRVRPDGRFAVTRRLRGPQRRPLAGRVVVRFSGNEALRAASQRLRAARRAVRLRVRRARARGKRLVVAGRVAPRGQRQVRIEVKFNRPNGDPAEIATLARVNARGRWRLRRKVPRAVRSLGAWVSVAHPGRERFFGQRLGRDVGG